MKKLLLSFFLLISFSLVLNAQEKENPKFNLLGKTFTNELKFEAKPVGTEEVIVYIYSLDNKESSNPKKLEKRMTIHRGLQTLKLDVSNLPKGEYVFELVQGVQLQKINRRVNRKVYSQNFRKN